MANSNNFNQHQPMSAARALDLLNAMINHLSVANRNKNVIHTLLNIGFTQEELVVDFHFCHDDVEEVMQEMEDEEDEE